MDSSPSCSGLEKSGSRRGRARKQDGFKSILLRPRWGSRAKRKQDEFEQVGADEAEQSSKGEKEAKTNQEAEKRKLEDVSNLLGAMKAKADEEEEENEVDDGKDAQKADSEGFPAMPVEDLEAKIKEQEDIIAEAEAHLKDELVKLQEQYQKLSADKEKVVEEIKAGGLGLMKSVKATKAAAAKAEL